jgi:hypothetical protein
MEIQVTLFTHIYIIVCDQLIRNYNNTKTVRKGFNDNAALCLFSDEQYQQMFKLIALILNT